MPRTIQRAGKKKPKKRVQTMMAGPANPDNPKNKQRKINPKYKGMNDMERYEAMIEEMRQARKQAVPFAVAHSSRYNDGPAATQRKLAVVKRDVKKAIRARHKREGFNPNPREMEEKISQRNYVRNMKKRGKKPRR